MAWIEQIDDEQATGALARSYKRLKARTKTVPHILKVQSLNPGALDRHLGLYTELMFGESPLTRRQREMIATTVSWSNGCFY